MLSVSATEFSENFGRYREAAEREPVAILSDGMTGGYFIAPAQFEAFERLKEQARQAYTIEELPDDLLEAIGQARMDPRHDHLDAPPEGDRDAT